MIPLLQPIIRQDVLDLIGWRDPEAPTKIMVVTGPNASGKSFVRRMMAVACAKANIECMSLSLELRTADGVFSSFIYGDESYNPTGLLTARTIKAGFKNAAERKKKCILLYDEPEIGMSEELQWAAVRHMTDQMKNPPKKLQGLVVMTHSRIFASHLVREVGATFINLGGQHPTLNEWLNRSVDINLDFLALEKEAHQKYLAITKLLKS